MQKFLNYKSKIVKSKRDSQKVQQCDLFQLVREYEQLKTIKKERASCNERPLCPIVLGKGRRIPEQECAVDKGRDIDDRMQIYDQVFIEKQQSTMNSLCEEDEFQLIERIEPAVIIDFPTEDFTSLEENQSQGETTPLYQSNRQATHYQKKKSLETKYNIQRVKEDLCHLTLNHEKVINFYEQSEHKSSYALIKNVNQQQYQITTRQPLELSQIYNSKMKIKERGTIWHEEQSIQKEDEERIEMLFRQEYKELFLSSISNINFSEGTNTTNSFKNELDISGGLLFNETTTNDSKFKNILEILNHKDGHFPTRVKENERPQHLQQKRQKVMILSKQETNQTKSTNQTKVPLSKVAAKSNKNMQSKQKKLPSKK